MTTSTTSHNLPVQKYTSGGVAERTHASSQFQFFFIFMQLSAKIILNNSLTSALWGLYFCPSWEILDPPLSTVHYCSSVPQKLSSHFYTVTYRESAINTHCYHPQAKLQESSFCTCLSVQRGRTTLDRDPLDRNLLDRDLLDRDPLDRDLSDIDPLSEPPRKDTPLNRDPQPSSHRSGR